MKTTVFTSLKGGVGKSMIIYNLSACLSERGYKVLVIDGDPQCNLTRAFTGKKLDNGLYEILTDEISVEKAIIQPYSKSKALENLYLIPCNYNLFLYEKDSSNSRQIFELRDKLTVLEKLNFDYVLIDTNPSLSFILTSIFTYVQNYIGVFDMSNDALDGFRFLDSTIISNIKNKVNSNLKFKGIILNNKKNSSFNTQFVNAVNKQYKDKVFKTIISDAVANKESRALNKPMIEYSARHQCTFQYADLASDFIKVLESDK